MSPVLYSQTPSYSSMFQKDLRSHICKGLEGRLVFLHRYAIQQALAACLDPSSSPPSRAVGDVIVSIPVLLVDAWQVIGGDVWHEGCIGKL